MEATPATSTWLVAAGNSRILDSTTQSVFQIRTLIPLFSQNTGLWQQII